MNYSKLYGSWNAPGRSRGVFEVIKVRHPLVYPIRAAPAELAHMCYGGKYAASSDAAPTAH